MQIWRREAKEEMTHNGETSYGPLSLACAVASASPKRERPADDDRWYTHWAKEDYTHTRAKEGLLHL